PKSAVWPSPMAAAASRRIRAFMTGKDSVTKKRTLRGQQGPRRWRYSWRSGAAAASEQTERGQAQEAGGWLRDQRQAGEAFMEHIQSQEAELVVEASEMIAQGVPDVDIGAAAALVSIDFKIVGLAFGQVDGAHG